MSTAEDIDMGKHTPKCSRCGSFLTYKDGFGRGGKQRFRCKLCGKSFVAAHDSLRPVVKEIAIGLIKQGIPVLKISQAMGRHCSKRWLYNLKSTVTYANR